MASKIYVVRHAESEHNVTKDFSILDPSLTQLGLEQASGLKKAFPNASSIAVIVTSPLRRAIQTTLAGFPNVLDQRYYDPNSGKGVPNGAALRIDPDLQERSDLPCDTGSSANELANAFPHLRFSDLGDTWPAKIDEFSADDDAVERRAARVRDTLRNLVDPLKDQEKKDVVVVTHGVFMKFLVEDPDIDLPRAGTKAYTLEGKDRGGSVLVPSLQ